MTDDTYSPIQVQAAQTFTVTVWDMERDSRVTLTTEGDVGRLLPHIERIVNEIAGEFSEEQ